MGGTAKKEKCISCGKIARSRYIKGTLCYNCYKNGKAKKTEERLQ